MSPPLQHDYIGLKGTELRLGLPGSESPDRRPAATLDLLPAKGAKRVFAHEVPPPAPAPAGKGKAEEEADGEDKKVAAPPQPAAKAQVVGWPPVRSYRKNTMATSQLKSSKEEADAKKGQGFLYVKVSMDGAPYLRKVDLKTYKNYKELSLGLEKMFVGFSTGRSESSVIPGKDGVSESRNDGEFVLTYEDKDGDWMLVGDVPWEMFTDSCRRLRIMKGSDAIGLAPRAGDKSKNKN
ncbi:auxin-responsive protein IAA3-like [Phragmites australis]|uniref:auxin-responsive protein IAA3-like n=1 Tax=Phragmites australis TaxID=29695 RepID=UPI002D79C528|nr:auxin-responsive protein IAA3-like [Phragmites australis]